MGTAGTMPHGDALFVCILHTPLDVPAVHPMYRFKTMHCDIGHPGQDVVRPLCTPPCAISCTMAPLCAPPLHILSTSMFSLCVPIYTPTLYTPSCAPFMHLLHKHKQLETVHFAFLVRQAPKDF